MAITQLQSIQKMVIQIIIILLIWAFAYFLQKIFLLPIASGILGFFILFFLFEVKWLKLESVAYGGDMLLSNLLLFFIPPVVGVIQYQALLMQSGWKILAVIIISTALVMMVSVWIVKIFLKEDDFQ
ncbi:CidA/LrgA family protein [Acinetobacter sp. ANC 4558]|uniref:CidA/LrgA family protein n=1 Tax=Acinetobacter sp. ANC 4558 TaxID=1977876 RepID=UPI000A35370D|nr:CidA/LrgA family protein [Acinetobacter sp. ANC 4558]OTG79556.1 CidA/LrgA family protein [Acinetobacter sp. ANC 4558]